MVDEDRRNGRFILLGSASRALVQQGSESLAGRIGFLTLTPFQLGELEKVDNMDFGTEAAFLKVCWLQMMNMAIYGVKILFKPM